MLAADVVEVHIDPFGRRCLQLAQEIAVSVIDGGIETELVAKHPRLGFRAGAADHETAPQLRELARDIADCARGARDKYPIAGFDVDEIQSDPRGQPRAAENAEVCRERLHGALDPADLLRVGYEVLAPAVHGADDVAGREAAGLRLYDFSDGSTAQRMSGLERCHVGILVHARTHVGIDRHVQVAHEHLPVARRRELRLCPLEVLERRQPAGA